MQNNSLTVELVVHQHVQVVLRVLNVDGHVHAFSTDGDGDWLTEILVFEKQSEVLSDSC